MMKEMIDACHEQGIAVVLYTSLVFDRWAADEHPGWRIRTWEGKIHGEGGRHGMLCVNSPYRDYVRRFVEEICGRFDFEGIRFDMTFWPAVCYCEHCRKRFAEECGGEMPVTVDWFDPRWVALQRSRERWLVQFARMATETVRKLKPNASIEHQSSTYPANWMLGVSADLAACNDFLQGDFYGSALEGSFVRKLLEDLSPRRPFGYETSFSVSLQDHTAMKSQALLEAKASAAIADHAAFIFIDAIDPVGTVNPRAHARMGRVFDRLMPYYEHLGGERVFDVGVYYSLESKFNFTGNRRHIREADTTDSHTPSCMAASRRLLSHHLPMGVITKNSLSRHEALKVLVLSNVHMMDREECDTIRRCVEGGGCLYASGGTSLVDTAGNLQKDFMLADVFGVSIRKADWTARRHYIAPTEAGRALFMDFDATYPAFCQGHGMEVVAHEGAEVLATTTLPWPAPDASRFASIHSDPPWQPTTNPEVVFHRFGRGQVIYCSSLLEGVDSLDATFVRLIRMLCHRFTYEVAAPPAVEVTLFGQPDRGRYVLSLVNFQNELPNLPVDGIDVSLNLAEAVNRIELLPEGRNVPFRVTGDAVTFRAPRLETLRMFAVHVTSGAGAGR
jgi:hypothetical protein